MRRHRGNWLTRIKRRYPANLVGVLAQSEFVANLVGLLALGVCAIGLLLVFVALQPM